MRTRRVPFHAIRKAGYHSVWKGERSWNGVAILARKREPILIRDVLPGNIGDKQSRYVEAAVEGIAVASIYLPNGNPQPGPKFMYKLAWFDRLSITRPTYWRKTPRPFLQATTTLYRPISTSTQRGRTKTTHCCSRRPARPTRSCWRPDGRTLTLYPDDPIFTFWSYLTNRWPRDAGLRLDHLRLSPAIAPRLRFAGVDREVRGEPEASDHAPSWIELKSPRQVALKRKHRSAASSS
jgi:exodeoxyribonuclease-3